MSNKIIINRKWWKWSEDEERIKWKKFSKKYRGIVKNGKYVFLKCG